MVGAFEKYLFYEEFLDQKHYYGIEPTNTLNGVVNYCTSKDYGLKVLNTEDYVFLVTGNDADEPKEIDSGSLGRQVNVWIFDESGDVAVIYAKAKLIGLQKRNDEIISVEVYVRKWLGNPSIFEKGKPNFE